MKNSQVSELQASMWLCTSLIADSTSAGVVGAIIMVIGFAQIYIEYKKGE